MLIGPARLCSMVSEHDDTLNPITEQLTIDIFSVPNIQVLMLNIYTYISILNEIYFYLLFSYSCLLPTCW